MINAHNGIGRSGEGARWHGANLQRVNWQKGEMVSGRKDDWARWQWDKMVNGKMGRGRYIYVRKALILNFVE